MKRHDLPIIGALAVLAVFIWTRDLRWMDSAADSLALLVSFPVFWWLRRPWERKTGVRAPLGPGTALVAAGLFGAGIAADSGLVLAAAWTALLASWMSAVFVEPSGGSTRKLLLLPLLGFPWLLTDLESVAWWFRLSGAAATEHVLAWYGVPVEREGTLLWCNGLGVSVEAACSGVNGLQSMLVVGGALAYVHLGRSGWFWWNLPLLAGAAWLANTGRIVAASLCGVWLEPAAAQRWVGPVHDVAGWVSLCAIFVLCHFLFSAEASWIARRARAGATRHTRWPVEALVLGYAMFCARAIVPSWRWTPYDQFGWLAFVIWLVPVWWALRRPPSAAGGGLRYSLAATGALLAGAASDINALHHVGLALAVAAFHPPAGRWVWLVGAAAWMPAAGFVGSRFGVGPEQFGLCRLFVAVVAAVWSIGLAMRRPTAPVPVLLPVRPQPAQ